MKAKKVGTYRDKYYTQVEYEYRGHKYEVEYANSIYCAVTPAWIQHRDAQAKIDDMIDNPRLQQEVEPFDLDEIWQIAFGE